MMLPDETARTRIRTDLDATLVVEAAAGTGKTTELVERIVAVVETGRAALHEVVAVTFTEKAAGELRLRLRARLEERLREAEPAIRARLEAAIAELEVAHIGTIHSLCADILKERPIEARVDPRFEVLGDGGSMERLYARAFEAWFQGALADPPPGVRRILRTRDMDGPRQLLSRAGLSLVEHRDHPTPWRRDPWDRDGQMAALRIELWKLALWGAAADEPHDPLAKALRSLAEVLADLDRTTDLDRVENELRQLRREKWWKHNGFRRSSYSKKLNLPRAFVHQMRDQAKTYLEAFARNSEHDVAALLHGELQGVVKKYEELKDERGALDFVDLLVGTRRLLLEAPDVRRQLQARFRRIFVDEFQDTDPLQVEILLLLALDDPNATDWRTSRTVPGKLFIVGDPKQSIYRFRRADVRLYEEVKDHLVAQGGVLLDLVTSFRARPGIQDFVNATFAPVMQGAGDQSQARYVPLAPHRVERIDIPAVVALLTPDVYNPDKGWLEYKRLDQKFPTVVGAWLHWLLTESGWTVEEDGEQVPVASRHVCLLFRKFRAQWRDVIGPYVAALESRGVPHVLVGGSAFHLREEIAALRTALVAIEWPDDELHVYGTLKGPLFGHTDEALLLHREHHGALHPLRRAGDDEVGESLALLGALHMQRNGRAIADTIQALLDATRAHAGFADWPNGEQTLANVSKLVELAQAFEAEGATSFRLFVEEQVREADGPGASDAAIVEEGTEGVRMMTAHKVKGLEFPIVVLCDPGTPAESMFVGHYADGARGLWLETLANCAPAELHEMEATVALHESRENVRLLYVATTRARDVLVVPAVDRGGLGDRWLGLLEKTIDPPAETRRAGRSAPGCPAFGPSDVPEDLPPSPSDPIVPGLHVRDGRAVVFWDPRVLALQDDHRKGLRAHDFLKKQDGKDDGRAAYETWKTNEATVRATAAKPQRIVRSVSELVQERGPSSTANITHERVALRTFQRPSGTRFGILVHAVLAEVPLDAARDGIANHAQVQGRLLGATPEETDAAIAAVGAALAHPVLVEARAAAELRREVPLQVRLPDGVLAEGVVDLAYRDANGWVVVDFKTDADPSIRKDEYERQVALYSFALRRATGTPVRGVLLTV
jgi:ATP-dependent helicase/nuclease subunit A